MRRYRTNKYGEKQMSSQVTVVLVHGALSDASIWASVIERLQSANQLVVAPALPLRGLASDVEYLDSFLLSIDTDVVLVGHSYAGSVISHSPKRQGQVKALVFIAAFQPDEGESAGALNSKYPGSLLGPDTLLTRKTSHGTDVYLKAQDFPKVYAGDVAAAVAAVMAVTQRPIDASAMEEGLTGEPAWSNVPSWALIATDDYSIPPETLRFMANRAQSKVTEVASSHAVPVSHPDEVVKIILEAIKS
jgi:pimeloyl-ACP methyl ester carboxylesterase